MGRTLSIWLACLVAIGGSSVSAGAEIAGLRPSAIVAGRYVAPDGSLRSNVAIFIAKGNIARVVPAENAPKSDRVVRYPSSVVCPGLIDIRATLGATDQNVETAQAVDPAVSAIDALDRMHRDWKAALEAGITTVMVAPSPSNVVCGVAAVFQTATGSTENSVLRADGPLIFALGSEPLESDRAPTSRMGAVAMLRQVIAEAKAGRGHQRVRAFVEGQLDAIAVCEEPMDVAAALRTLSATGRRLHIQHTSDALDLAAELSQSNGIVIVGPFSFNMSPRTLALPGVLTAAGVSVALAGNLPTFPSDSLRITAALAVRYGMNANAARRAITTVPALAAGIGERTGAIQPGRQADFVVFSDDPLRLDARVLEVYVRGERVFRADDMDDHPAKPGDAS